ncbi:2OG-Fe(II) oxygenase [Mucor ambiguus]|uniref:2OG-Fe(II) oxygenase n=1 Tax=Mucor ambiguus TaxID=91626 RepID=A0A0C9MXE6_9FUNG|nr:2OG-Fe(II) oxygenase [Mucor ambiguus]
MSDFMRIDLSNFDDRKEEIAQDLMKAASEHGFFYVVNHDISVQDITAMFESSHSFFELPDKVKENYHMDYPRNAGWEKLSQIRPSTGVADLKESLQLSFHNASDLRPTDDHVPGFDKTADVFMEQCNNVSQQLLICFAIGLGFPQDFFTRCHDITQPDCLNSLRCMRYFEHKNQKQQTKSSNIGACRVGAHTDINTFSLLFQQPGQDGLEVFHDNVWTPISPKQGEIVCNVGDMIVRWSDDLLQSKLHRVRNPNSEQEYQGPRYALEYINEANRSVIIQGRTKYTQPITAGEFLMMAMEKNYKKALLDQNITITGPITSVPLVKTLNANAVTNATTASPASTTSSTAEEKTPMTPPVLVTV